MKAKEKKILNPGKEGSGKGPINRLELNGREKGNHHNCLKAGIFKNHHRKSLRIKERNREQSVGRKVNVRKFSLEKHSL